MRPVPPKISLEPTTDEPLQTIEDRLLAGSKRMELMDAEMTRNTELTQDIRDLLAAFKGGFKVLGWLGAGVKWAGMVAAAVLALWTAFYAATHGGVHPK